MNLKKNRKFILLALLTLLLVSSVMLLAACNPGEDVVPVEESPAEETTDTLRIKNSDFSRTTSDAGSYPYVPTSWTGVDQSSSLLPQYSTGGIVAGIVSAEDAVYDANKSKWGGLEKPSLNGAPEDKNMLMIYNSEPSSYAYNSTSFQVTAGAVYKITVDVLTVNLRGNATLEESARKYGARIYISSSTYIEFKQIDTKGAWKTYTMYVAGNVGSATSITLQFALGTGTSESSDGLTAGYAFFDNITVDETVGISEFQEKELTGQTGDNDDAPLRTATLRGNNNGDFNFGSTTSTAGYPSLWTGKLGGDDSNSDDKAPSDSGISSKYGVLDLTKWSDNRKNYGNSYYDYELDEEKNEYNRVSKEAGTVYLSEEMPNPSTYGDNIYMLYQARMSARAVYSNNSITIERGKWYAVSVWVYTKRIYGAGVSIILKGGREDIKIEGISETRNLGEVGENDTDGWEQYTFWISGNQHRSMTYTLEIWLGTGGKADNELIAAPNEDELKDLAKPEEEREGLFKYAYDGNTENYLNWMWKSSVNSTTKLPEREYFETYTSGGTFTSGWVFVDNVGLKEYNDITAFEDERDAAFTASVNEKQNKIAELYSDGNTLIENGSFAHNTDTGLLPKPDAWTVLSDDNDKDGVNDGTTLDGVDITKTVSGVADTADAGGEYLSDEVWSYTDKNPKTPYEYIDTYGGGAESVFKVLMIDNRGKDGQYKYQSSDFKFVRNGYYRLSVWVKTVGIKTTAGVGAYLYQKNKDYPDDRTKDSLLSSFTLINNTTKSGDETTEYSNVRTNDWIELVFKIQSDSIKDADAYIVLASGSGSRGKPDTLSDGVAFFAYPSLEKITASDYDGISTGTYAKSVTVTFSESNTSNTFNNGAFNNIDVKNTKGLNEDGRQTGMDKNASGVHELT
ncbi:MAG: hypothetical protein LBC13_01360, partial [Clostridiales bacterium]|nr:hypothetical protein [Clostridiales bacterium]